MDILFSKEQRSKKFSRTVRRFILPNPELCRGCGLCELACSIVHEGKCQPSLSRISILKNHEEYNFKIFVCTQCNAPRCMKECPHNVIRIEEGTVIILEDKCKGCGICANVCPFNSNGRIIFQHFFKKIYVKCDLCLSTKEKKPMCIDVCPSGALILKEEKGG